ncbi:MAG: hypothetical protein NTY09_12845 [bacterium]|nr:hypothetical protein [bacterium]
MKVTLCRLLFFVFSSIAFLLLAIPVFANAYSTWQFREGNIEQMYFADDNMRLYILVIVIFIEAFLVYKLTNLTRPQSIAFSIVVNLVSATVGLLIRIPAEETVRSSILLDCLPLFFVILFALAMLFLMRAPWYFYLTGILSILVGSYIVKMNLGWEINWVYRSRIFLMMAGPILIPYGVSLLVEAVPGYFWLKGKDLWRTILIINTFSYFIIVLLIPIYAPGMKQPPSQSSTLRTPGSSQLAYQQHHQNFPGYPTSVGQGNLSNDVTLNNLGTSGLTDPPDTPSESETSNP